MKQLFIISVFLFSLSNYAQELKYEDGKFYQVGRPISNKNAKALLESYPKAIELYKTSKTKKAVGGFMLGFGSGLVLADLATGLFADIKYPTAATYIGLGTIVISIPILSGKNKKMNEALDIYNSNIKKTGFNNNHYQMDFVTNQNGLGLKFEF
jgi:hypothetical protein